MLKVARPIKFDSILGQIHPSALILEFKNHTKWKKISNHCLQNCAHSPYSSC